MKFLYVAPRFHPNQYPIIEGLISKGHEVMFCVSRIGSTEKHDGVTVKLMTPSAATKRDYEKACRKGENYAEDKMIFWFSPDKKEVFEILRQYSPDVVIMRERNMLSLAFANACRSLKIKKVILYNQSPIYNEKGGNFFKNALKELWRSRFPKTRITVCRYKDFPREGVNYIEDKNAHFLPFIIRERSELPEREYCKDGTVRIFDCGKYRPYKNHTVLVDAAKRIVDKGIKNFHITIVGQASSPEEIEYFESLKKKIAELGLDAYFDVEKSVPYDQMPKLFLSHDVFVLTSKRELANVSILDAMSYAMPVVATSDNGTSDYVVPETTGHIFKTNDPDDLSEKLEFYLSDPDKISEFGKNALAHVVKNHSFDSYYESLMSVISSIK